MGVVMGEGLTVLLTQPARGRTRRVPEGLRAMGLRPVRGRLSSAQVAGHDVVLPLANADVVTLGLHFPHERGRRYLAPTLEAFRTCEDKEVLTRRLAAEGFARNLPLPVPGERLVRKPRVGDSGADVSIRPWAPVPEEDPVWTWQRALEAPVEYTAHLLIRDRILMSKGLAYDRGTGAVRSGIANMVGRVFDLPEAHLALFRDMLNAIGFQGFACVNYFVEDGCPLVIEINGRLGASLLQVPEWIAYAYCEALYPGCCGGRGQPRWPAQIPERSRTKEALRGVERGLRRALRPG